MITLVLIDTEYHHVLRHSVYPNTVGDTHVIEYGGKFYSYHRIDASGEVWFRECPPPLKFARPLQYIRENLISRSNMRNVHTEPIKRLERELLDKMLEQGHPVHGYGIVWQTLWDCGDVLVAACDTKGEIVGNYFTFGEDCIVRMEAAP